MSDTRFTDDELLSALLDGSCLARGRGTARATAGARAQRCERGSRRSGAPTAPCATRYAGVVDEPLPAVARDLLGDDQPPADNVVPLHAAGARAIPRLHPRRWPRASRSRSAFRSESCSHRVGRPATRQGSPRILGWSHRERRCSTFSKTCRAPSRARCGATSLRHPCSRSARAMAIIAAS